MERMSAAEFVEENLKTIFAYALSRVANKDDAEDLTNDIVVAILQSADKLRNPDAFYGYVWGIAANTYRKFMRRKKRFLFEEVDENFSDETDFTEEMLAGQEILALRREIALLSKEYRECTIAYYFDGLSCAEVSEKLGISLEMVKYYLFKTRKILKEGISMEREFGEKSFKPATFEFRTIFSGKFNPEYRSLFSRKLPGQILLSAYYTPMTVRELAIELGVASVYLEDEIALLEKYNLIAKRPTGKYQTNLVIFTDDFTDEFIRSAEKLAVPALGEILSGVKGKLGQIRAINGVCEKLSDSRLMWGLLWSLMGRGHEKFRETHADYESRDTIYDGATGTNFGVADHLKEEYRCDSFAGYAGISEEYYASAADFGILPNKNRFFTFAFTDENRKALADRIRNTVSGKNAPEFLVFTVAEEGKLFEILDSEISQMGALYEKLFSCSCEVMRIHAPKSMANQIDRVIFQTLIFRTIGLIGALAVKSDMLPLPDFDGPAAVLVRENTKAAEASVSHDVEA